MDSAQLKDGVRALMAGNRVETADGFRYTRPAAGTYPHQWLWDSCFHARIHHWLGDRAMAADELRALFRAQVEDGPDRGRLPHMTLHAEGASQQYARDVALWGSPLASTITQPPIVAEVVLEIGDPALWRQLWGPLSAYHDWWLRRRDPRGDKLVVCHHVWETGADATPRADGAFQRLLASGRTPRALDKGTVNLTARKRPELLAARFLMLEDLQEIDAGELSGALAAGEADRRRLELYGHVAVEMQAFLHAGLLAMARIGEALGLAAAAARYRGEAAAIARAVNQELWDEERGWYLDRWGDPPQTVRELTYAPFVALHAGDLVPVERAARLLAHLEDPATFATRWPIPTAAKSHPTFDPDEYWRGSTWLNVNWFAVRGLAGLARRAGEERFRAAARRIAAASVEAVAAAGFREYYRSDGAEPAGFGPEGFSWSGLVLDLARMLETELA
jgi:glycogen debranching enzyme